MTSAAREPQGLLGVLLGRTTQGIGSDQLGCVCGRAPRCHLVSSSSCWQPSTFRREQRVNEREPWDPSWGRDRRLGHTAGCKQTARSHCQGLNTAPGAGHTWPLPRSWQCKGEILWVHQPELAGCTCGLCCPGCTHGLCCPWFVLSIPQSGNAV